MWVYSEHVTLWLRLQQAYCRPTRRTHTTCSWILGNCRTAWQFDGWGESRNASTLGLGDKGATSQPANNQVILDQSYSSPMLLDNNSDCDMPAVTMEPHFNTQQNHDTDISDVGVTRTRDLMAQVSTGLLSSSWTRTNAISGAGQLLLINATVQLSPLPIDTLAHGAGRGTLDMTHSPGFGDEAPTPHLNNNQAIFDQDHSSPMELDSEPDCDLPDVTMETHVLCAHIHDTSDQHYNT